MLFRRHLAVVGATICVVLSMSVPAHGQQSNMGDDAFLNTLHDAVTALEVEDEPAYLAASEILLDSDFWYPEATRSALDERNADLLVTIWLAVNADEDELLLLAVNAITTERDDLAAASANGEDGSDGPRLDDEASAMLEVIDHRGIPIPESAAAVMRRRTSTDPSIAEYDLAIRELDGIIDGTSAPADLRMTAPAPPPTTSVAADPVAGGRAAMSGDTTNDLHLGVVAGMGLGVIALGAVAVAIARNRHDRMADLAYRDGLTGLNNRRRFDSDITDVGRRGTGPTALLMVDVDHFKNVNDVYGHALGDRVLREIADVVSTVLRSGDVAYRYGGEEFCVLLPNTSADEASAVAERLRDEIGRHVIELDGTVEITVTASIGVACGPAGSIADTIDRADKAMYSAKQAGRNRFAVA